jgi:hypothetical protein
MLWNFVPQSAGGAAFGFEFLGSRSFVVLKL